MEKYYPELDREFFSVNPSLTRRSCVEIKCLKCSSRWRVEKKDAEKKHGILRLLDHEYGHRNKP